MEGQAIEQKKGKGRVKPKVLKDAALTAGLDALRLLESSEVAARPVQATARTLVQEGIESIMRSRARGVPLLRIYNDAKRAAGLKISFQTFSSYVCEIAKDRGLSLEKKRAAVQPGASTPTVAALAQAPVEHMEHGQEKAGWNCDCCLTDSQRHESQKRPGAFFWRCAKCGQAYADNGGTITNEKL